MKKQKKSLFESIFLQLDLYGQGLSFRVNGHDSFKTMFGAALSLLVTILVIAYGASKYTILVNRGDTTHNKYIEDGVLSK